MSKMRKLLVIMVLFSTSLIANEALVSKSVVGYGYELNTTSPCQGPIGPCAN